MARGVVDREPQGTDTLFASSERRVFALLGYDPKVELEEGMRRSIRWMLDRGEKL